MFDFDKTVTAATWVTEVEKHLDEMKEEEYDETEEKEIEEDDDDNKEEQEKYSLQNFRKNYGKEKNYILDKINRISKALELNNIYNNDDKNNKKEKFKEKDINIKPMACINSVLMAKMLKYINKESREQIISLRTCERHLNNQSDD